MEIPLEIRCDNTLVKATPYCEEIDRYVSVDLQRILADQGLAIVLFSGDTTAVPELSHNSGDYKILNGKRSWSEVAGAYEDKTIFLKTDPSYPVLVPQVGPNAVSLHEMGHAFDEIIGSYLENVGILNVGASSCNLSADPVVHNEAELIRSYQFSNDATQDRIRMEFFAYRFAEFCLCETTWQRFLACFNSPTSSLLRKSFGKAKKLRKNWL